MAKHYICLELLADHELHTKQQAQAYAERYAAAHPGRSILVVKMIHEYKLPPNTPTTAAKWPQS